MTRAPLPECGHHFFGKQRERAHDLSMRYACREQTADEVRR
ncbi:MAG: hypothetical protein UY89_C0034G0008, partial [Parcubacteria group bacterium GW2011_GWA1_54_9]